MPDDDSQLTMEQKEAAIAWLVEHGAGKPICPGCGKQTWEVGDHLVSPPIHSGGGMMLGGISYPNFMIICTNCGNTQYFNAIVAKLEKPGKKEKEGEEKPRDPEKMEGAADG